MTHFKNILSVAVLVAVVSFSNFSMIAQTKSQVKDRTPDKEYMLSDENLACEQASEDELFVYDEENMDLMVSYLNIFTPYTLDEDIELSSIDMTDKEININTTCDYNTALEFEIIDVEYHEHLEQVMAAALYELFNAMGPDDNGDSMIAKMIEYDITVNYNFYIKGFDVPVKTLSFSARTLEHAGLVEKMVYSI